MDVFEHAPLRGRQDGGFLDTPLGNKLKDPFGSTTLQANTLWIALGTSFGSMLVVTILFSLVRPHNRVVYAPKLKVADSKHQPPAVGNGFFDWVTPVKETKEDQLVAGIGLDAAIFLRFLRMCRNMFAVLALIGCIILIPVHITTTKSLLPNAPNTLTDSLAAITPLNVTGTALWAHVAASYCFDIIVMIFLWYNYRKIVAMKRRYFQTEEYTKSLHARSVWLMDIPNKDRSDEGILRILDSVEQTASIPRAAIARQAKDLQDAIKDHDEAVRDLESVLAKYLKNPEKLSPTRPTMNAGRKDKETSGKVDAIDYLTRRIKNLRTVIRDMRSSIAKLGVEGYGFATYDQIEDAHTVAYAGRKKKPRGVRIRLAPSPKDLVWGNLTLSKANRSRKRIVLNFWIVILTVIYIIPNAFIAAFLSNLSNLANVWPAFAVTYENDVGLWQFVQAVLSPALLSGIYLLLPILFRRWSTSSGDLTKTKREQHVIQKLYVFFVFNNLIVFSVFSTLFGFILSVVSIAGKGENVWQAIQDADITNALLKTLCTVSNFWFIWLIQRNLGAAIDIAQLFNLVYKWFVRTFMAPTPRQAIEWTGPPPFDYASYYNWFLFYVTVALCFATVQPLVLLVTFVYFLIDTWLKKYLLLYVFVTKTESGGQFWNLVVNRILFATFMANIVAALVIKGCWGQWGSNYGGNATSYYMMGSLIPLPIMLLAFKIYCSKMFADQLRYVATSRHNVEAGGLPMPRDPMKSGNARTVFGNPDMTERLMKPMVNKKYQSMLREILKYDFDSDQAHGEPGAIEMRGRRPESVMTTDTRIFEFVSESDMDFANFANRPEFADQHGGNGALYGRPEDISTDGRRTPGSVMSEEDYRSRSGSPQPIGAIPRKPRPSQGHQYNISDPVPMYNSNNNSQRSLLGGAGPGGFTQVDSGHGYEQQAAQQGHVPYTMNSFTSRVSGYGPVPAQAEEEEEDIAAYGGRPTMPKYESYSSYNRGYRQ